MSNKNRFSALAISLLMMLGAQAQTIHWLTFFDTQDKAIGEMDANSRNAFYNRFVNVVNNDLSLVGYKADIQDFRGDGVSQKACVDALDKLTCDSLDIVVFYYVGHGLHAENDQTNYPSMALGTNSEMERTVPLSWVHRELKKKGARLVITIGSCSNIMAQSVTTEQKGSNTDAENRIIKNVAISAIETSSLQRAFLCHKGDIIISAASLGQPAFGGSTPMGDMDLLTAVFITFFEDMTYDKSFSWDLFLDESSNIIRDITNGKQVPCYQYELHETSMPE